LDVCEIHKDKKDIILKIRGRGAVFFKSTMEFEKV